MQTKSPTKNVGLPLFNLNQTKKCRDDHQVWGEFAVYHFLKWKTIGSGMVS